MSTDNYVYSIIKFVNNTFTGEFISIGLITVASGDKVLCKLSQEKIELAKTINPECASMLQMLMDCYVAPKNFDDLQRQIAYHNGILQFSSTSLVTSEMNQEIFDLIFDKWILNKS